MSKIAVIGLVGKTIFMEVPHFHRGGETVHASGLHEEWGGKGFNQAVAAARQGAEVAFLGAASVSDVAAIDAFSRGERVSAVICGKGEPSACATILTDGTGETRVTVFPGARLEAADVDRFARQIGEADFLLLNNEVPEEVNVKAMRLAAEAGVKVIYNPAPERALPPEIREGVFVFTPNEFEEAALGEVKGEVVTTLGAKGCRIRSTGEVLPVTPCGRPVDSTGAGDTFNAALAVRLAEGETLADACAAANGVAAESVTRRYVMPSLPYRLAVWAIALLVSVTACADVIRFMPTVLTSGATNLVSGLDWREPLKRHAPTCTASVGVGGPTDPAAVARRMVVEKKSFAYWRTGVRGVKAGRVYLGGGWARYRTANLCLWWQGRPVGHKADEWYRIYCFSGYSASLERYLTEETKARLAGDPNEWRLFYRTFRFSAPLTDEACEIQYGFYDGNGDMTFAEPFLIDVTEAPRTMELELKGVRPVRSLEVICLDLRDPVWRKDFDPPVTDFKATLPETVDAFRNAGEGGVPGNMLIVRYADGTEAHYAAPAEGEMFSR